LESDLTNPFTDPPPPPPAATAIANKRREGKQNRIEENKKQAGFK